MMPGNLAHEPQTPQVPISTSAEAIFAWFAECSLPVWIAFSLAGNVAIFLFSVGLCGLLGYLFRDRSLFDRPQPVTRAAEVTRSRVAHPSRNACGTAIGRAIRSAIGRPKLQPFRQEIRRSVNCRV